MDYSQLGRAGELALSLYSLVTSAGELELYSPVVDDDHVDLVAAVRGGLPKLGIQVKTTDHLDDHGYVEAKASYPKGHVREDPAFIYAVLMLESVRFRWLWIVPSADFNRLTDRYLVKGREDLEFRARPESHGKFSPFTIEPLELGPVLLSRIATVPEPPEWLRSLAPSTAR